MYKDPFEEYLRAQEPGRKQLGYAWQTAVGLQKVDDLEPSRYLIETAKKSIEGEITLDTASELIHRYYEQRPKSAEPRTEEADKVSVRIAQILSEKAFIFSATQYLSIHKRLFEGIYSHAGTIRDYNITKKEWVLDGDTVLYGGASELKATLEYDLATERAFRYQGLSMNEVIRHLAVFVSRLWQIHVFGEGNTRTTAVFFIQYLRSLGFDVTNDTFAENAWYFRNAMVRANYTNLTKGVRETTEYLELFLRNLLLGERNELKNRYLHISGQFKPDHSGRNQDIESRKQDIADRKQDIEVFFPYADLLKTANNNETAMRHTRELFDAFGFQGVFGRKDVCEITHLSPAAASVLLKKLLSVGAIAPVSGQGKGKYRFKKQ